MIDKYIALQNTTDWIINSSIEEFMSTFNELGDNYEGITLGEYIDLFIDAELDNSIEYNILTTDNFIFGAEVEPVVNNFIFGAEVEPVVNNFVFDAEVELITDSSVLETHITKEVSVKSVQHIELNSNLTDCYSASNDELYDFSWAA